ncbi:MAG: NUDIX hydrolase [Deltaproteobacteria bacterium]|nr:NUDIX hydrolase [Deltaproteobacteria bacterium]
MTPVEPKDAATVLLARDAPGGAQLFMVRRHKGNRFMANAHVFVGGRVDEADADPATLARCTGLRPEEAAARLGLEEGARALAFYVAAVREAFEEAGVLLAEDEPGYSRSAPLRLDELREQLNAGSLAFGDFLARERLVIPADRLRYLAHWITPTFEPKRFSARFFICQVPADQQARFDPRETSAGEWLTVREILDGNREKRLQLAPPTLCILEALLPSSATAGALVAAAGDRPLPSVRPEPLMQSTALTLILPEDRRYGGGAAEAGPEHYLVLEDGVWVRYRRD